MQKNNAAKKIDLLFLSVSIYFILYMTFIYFFEGVIFCLILSALTLLVIYLLYFAITKKKREKFKVKKKETEHLLRVFQSMPMLGKEQMDFIINRVFENSGYSISKNDYIYTCEKNGIKRTVGTCFYKEAGSAEICLLEQQRRNSGADGFILLCSSANHTAEETLLSLSNPKSCIVTQKQLYCAMKKAEAFPPLLSPQPKKRRLFKDIFAFAFARARFKSYFMLAVIMFLFSYVTPFKTYYLIFAAVLFLFCIFSLTGGKEIKTTDDTILSK